MRLPAPPLLLITARSLARSALPDVMTRAFDGGCRWVMVREKDLEAPARRTLVEQIMEAAAPFEAKVVVNSDLAAAEIAHGVHLPQGQSCTNARKQLGPDKIIGVSAHTAGEAGAAATAGANYVTMSPIFPTQSKPGYGPPLYLEGLRDIAKRVPVPVIALGGVTAATARSCQDAGAAGVAVMGTIMRASDPAYPIYDILSQLRTDAVSGGTRAQTSGRR